MTKMYIKEMSYVVNYIKYFEEERMNRFENLEIIL